VSINLYRKNHFPNYLYNNPIQVIFMEENSKSNDRNYI